MEEYFHLCPSCFKKIVHKNKRTHEAIMKNLRTGKTIGRCRKCVCASPEWKSRQRELNSGDKNPFYGKKHSEEVLSIISTKNKGKIIPEETRLKMARHGSDNGMFNKTVYDVWEKKLSPEDYKSRVEQWKNNHKNSCKTGTDHYMFGKPPPIGSGNGWSGWYKGWFFRSIKELTYMIDVIEANGFKWESAEKKDFRIFYNDENGNTHVYHPDFFINDKILVEVKPKKLMKTKINILKHSFAVNFCKSKGWEYQMVDIENIDQERLIDLWNDGVVKFIDKYEERIKTIIGKVL